MSRAKPPLPSRRVEIKTAIFLIVVVTTGPLGAVFLREGMKHAHLLAGWNPMILVQISRMILTNGEVWLGIGSRIVCALAFMCMLSWADYSFVNPASSVSYVIAVFMGWAMLGEVVPPGRWIGAILICLGVLFIGKTPARTTEPEEKSGNAL
ncbi:MAG TPA: EamA family transporter [Patescibacteria group bacterium]|nr:EamA family transporter [Patescibacteria group bacterium]